jgi:hypothetical protein
MLRVINLRTITQTSKLMKLEVPLPAVCAQGIALHAMQSWQMGRKPVTNGNA